MQTTTTTKDKEFTN